MMRTVKVGHVHKYLHTNNPNGYGALIHKDTRVFYNIVLYQVSPIHLAFQMNKVLKKKV